MKRSRENRTLKWIIMKWWRNKQIKIKKIASLAIRGWVQGLGASPMQRPLCCLATKHPDQAPFGLGGPSKHNTNLGSSPQKIRPYRLLLVYTTNRGKIWPMMPVFYFLIGVGYKWHFFCKSVRWLTFTVWYSWLVV